MTAEPTHGVIPAPPEPLPAAGILASIPMPAILNQSQGEMRSNIG